jgi:hypothetical protein
MRRAPWMHFEAFQDFSVAIVDVFDDLGENAHVEPLSAARTFHEMIGLSFGDALGIAATSGHRSLATLLRPQ